jgi:DNA replication protein DnaC
LFRIGIVGNSKVKESVYTLRITSQLPVSHWHDIIGEQTIADAVLDRIVHNAHRIELMGVSLCKRQILLN